MANFTTLNVSSPTLAYIKRMRGLLEYALAGSISNDDAMLLVCLAADMVLQEKVMGKGPAPGQRVAWATQRLFEVQLDAAEAATVLTRFTKFFPDPKPPQPPVYGRGP